MNLRAGVRYLTELLNLFSGNRISFYRLFATIKDKEGNTLDPDVSGTFVDDMLKQLLSKQVLYHSMQVTEWN